MVSGRFWNRSRVWFRVEGDATLRLPRAGGVCSHRSHAYIYTLALLDTTMARPIPLYMQ